MRKAEEEVTRLKARVRKIERERATLRRYVELMHWVQPLYNGSPSCAYCGRQQHLHEGDCDVSRYLASIGRGE